VEAALAAEPLVLQPAPGHGDRVGVYAFAVQGRDVHELATGLGARGVAIRAGKFCAHPLVRHLRGSLGLEPEGGLLRVSLAASTGLGEVERFTSALHELLEPPGGPVPAFPETPKELSDRS
jgi:selenocysteine lyase/cysteine desulfurase